MAGPDEGAASTPAPTSDTTSVGSNDASEYGGHETAADAASDDWSALSGFDVAVADVERAEPPAPGDVPDPTVTTTSTEPKVEAKPGVTPQVSTPPKVVEEKVQPQAAQPTSAQPDPQQGGEQSPDNLAAGSDDLSVMMDSIDKNLPALVEQVAAQHFNINPQVIEAIANGEGATHIPRIMAHGYLKSVQTTMTLVKDMVPKMLKTEIDKFRRETMRDGQFFKQFPSLDRVKHGKDIRAFASTIRQMNPQMSEADLLAKVGTAVMAMHGLVAAPTPPTPPASKPNGFVPANAGRPAPVRSQPAPDGNEWAGLLSDD